MNIEVSQELLSDVLGVGVYQGIRKDKYAFDDIKLNVINTELLYSYINIYEFAHKCKVWAHNKGYMLNTVILTADNKTWYCEDDYRKTRTTWKDDSEPLVIFKACEWILNNKPL